MSGCLIAGLLLSIAEIGGIFACVSLVLGLGGTLTDRWAVRKFMETGLSQDEAIGQLYKFKEKP